jgi:hypothetical protein
MKTEFLISLGLALFIIAGFAYMSRSNIDRSFGQDGDRACCAPKDYTGLLDPDERTAVYEGRSIGVPDLVFDTKVTDVLGVSQEERWIEVDISEQKLRAWEGDELFLETLVSTGLPWYPTPQGEFWIWIKLRATKMEGGSGRYYYYLPNVPYVFITTKFQLTAVTDCMVLTGIVILAIREAMVASTCPHQLQNNFITGLGRFCLRENMSSAQPPKIRGRE